MRTEAKIWALILVATAGLGGFGAWRQLSAPAPVLPPASSEMGFVGNERNAPVPTRAQLAELQTLADNSCRCARTSGRPSNCWRAFNLGLSRFPNSEMVSACVPLSTTIVCFGEDMANCVVRDHGGGTCSSEEARTIEAIWTDATREGGWNRPAPASRQRSGPSGVESA